MKTLLFVAAALLMMALPIQAQKNSTTTNYSVSIDCQNCVDKITKDLAFVRGVRDLEFNIEEKTVAVTYRYDRVDKGTLAQRMRDLGYEVEEIKKKEEKEEAKSKAEISDKKN